MSDGANSLSPRSSVVPSSGSFPGVQPANGPVSGLSSGASGACSLVKPLSIMTSALVFLSVKLIISLAL